PVRRGAGGVARRGWRSGGRRRPAGPSRAWRHRVTNPRRTAGRPVVLHTVNGAAGSRVLGFGHYQPANVVTNHDLASRVDTTDEWIRDRVGVVERPIAGPEESVVAVAVQAAGKPRAAGGLAAAGIDLVVVAACTLESGIPNAAPRVAERLGIGGCAAFDLNTACSGFCYALSTVDSLVRT